MANYERNEDWQNFCQKKMDDIIANAIDDNEYECLKDIKDKIKDINAYDYEFDYDGVRYCCDYDYWDEKLICERYLSNGKRKKCGNVERTEILKRFYFVCDFIGDLEMLYNVEHIWGYKTPAHIKDPLFYTNSDEYIDCYFQNI